MAYFPFFIELSGKRGLIVGGGAVALRKVRKLLPYGPRLTVVAPEMDPALRAVEGLKLYERPFAPEDLNGCAFAVAATGDRAVNRQVALLCARRRILADVADCGEEGSFVFPALVKRGDLSVGISTGGAFPLAAVYVKEQLQALLPREMDAVVVYLNRQRQALLERETDKTVRDRALAALCRVCMERGRPLEEAETAAVLAAAAKKEG